MKKTKIVELFILVAVILPFVLVILSYPQLPPKVPVHWDIHGETDGFASPSSNFLLAFTQLFLYFLLVFVPKIDPKKDNYELFMPEYQKLRLVIHLFFAYLIVLVLGIQLDYFVGMGTGLKVGFYLFFMGLFNYMTTLRPNYTVGIRTPWTLASESVWRKTHLFGGRLGFGICLFALILDVFIFDFNFLFMIITVLLLAFLPLFYSYFLYKAENQTAINEK